ncbi:MAG TPA: hypothetical protein VGW12_19155 [Pyrinomonadaceae bacterium]|nr:hypothetical protein [Pyrinomonadaceae bacterium]
MNKQNSRTLKSTALWLVGFHFLAVVVHSVAHEILSVKATPAQLAFIIPVIIFAPVVAGFMLSRFSKAGAVLLLASMLGSFVFGLYYHFIADTIDHVAHVAQMQPAFWSAMFQITAYLLLLSEGLGVVVAGVSLASQTQSLKRYEARTDF